MKPEKLPYYKELYKIREVFEQINPHFPKDGCQHISYIISDTIPQISQVAGTFRNYPDLFHAFNYDEKNNIYIDLTADQFENLDKIFITTKNEAKEYYTINQSFTRKQRELYNNDKKFRKSIDSIKEKI